MTASGLSDTNFTQAMAALGPFEPEPRIAVAVSGGADSLALVVLMDTWARSRGGRVTALTVDHGLRPEAAREARQVTKTLLPLNIEHHILHRRGEKPTTNLQAEARALRYDLLVRWCRTEGVLHLALGHHREDQAETFLLRLGRGSGLDGLAAMAPVNELPDVRLLRPLLAFSKSNLEATLTAQGLPWIKDPSNLDITHARVRLRRLMPTLAAEGLTAARLADTAGRLGRARAALTAEVAAVLARAVMIHPAGFAVANPVPLTSAAPEVGLRALARILMAVSGAAYPPRLRRLERLYALLTVGAGKAATLCGCRIIPHRGRLLIVREVAATVQIAVKVGDSLHWDHRFDCTIDVAKFGGGIKSRRQALNIASLGQAGWAEVVATDSRLRRSPIPLPARVSLPTLRDGKGILSVPHLGYQRPKSALTIKKCSLSMGNNLSATAFTVV